VSLAYTPNCYWRNRSEFIRGRAEIIAFLKRKWAKELDYRLIKELWAFTENRIAVRFAYEWLRAMTSSRPTHSVSVDEVTLANSHASKQLETLRAQTEHRSGGAIAFSAFGPRLRPAIQPRPLHTYQVQYSGMIWFRAAVDGASESTTREARL
jgi:Protein of unknown function (DUF1348)